MAKYALPLSQEDVTFIEEWKKAKKIETEWAAYRKVLEDDYKARHAEQLAAIAQQIRSNNVLSTSVEVGDLQASVQFELQADKSLVARFVQEYPETLGILFKPEYKLDARTIRSAINSNQVYGATLKEMITEKQKGVYFSEKK